MAESVEVAPGVVITGGAMDAAAQQARLVAAVKTQLTAQLGVLERIIPDVGRTPAIDTQAHLEAHLSMLRSTLSKLDAIRPVVVASVQGRTKAPKRPFWRRG